MPLPLTVSCFSKIQIGFTFLVPAHLGSPRKGPLNGCCCCCVLLLFINFNLITVTSLELHIGYCKPFLGGKGNELSLG